MRKEFQTVFTRIFVHHLILERERLRLTQEQMAELLAMSLRGYINLEHGQSSGSSLTLVLFLIYGCKDNVSFLSEIKAALEDVYASI